MKWYCVFFFFLAPFTELFGESLHALIACDTRSNIRTSTRKDIAHLRTSLREISIQTGLHLSMRFLYGDNLSTEKVQAWISSVKKKPPDIVLFYYSGHGFRTRASTTPWPSLYFPKKLENISSETVYNDLRTLPSRLVIIILDCCNTVMKGPPSLMAALAPDRGHQRASLPGLKTLFIRTEGIIIAAGSSPGESAFAQDDGSIFTNSLIQALSTEAKNEEVSWKNIFDRVSMICSPRQRPISFLQVTPIAHKSARKRLHRPRAKDSHAGKVMRHSTDVATMIRIAS